MQPDLTVNLDARSQLRLNEQLQLLALTPQEKRRLVGGIGKDVRRESKKNITAQRTIPGRKFEPRKDKRNRRKMLMGLRKPMKVEHRNELHVDVTWNRQVTAQIAYQHQHGVDDQWSATKAKKMYGKPRYSAPATRAQAQALIDEGYKRPSAKKRGRGVALKRVSQKWIRENMHQGQAGFILKLLRTRKATGKKSWTIHMPARPFLGVPLKKADEYMTQMARQGLRKIR